MQVRELYTQFIIDKQNEGYSERAVEFLANRLSSIQNYLDVDIGDRPSRKKHAQNFLYLTKTLDHVRNETFLDIFPELKDYWDACMELPLPQWRVKKYLDYNRAKNV